MSGRWPDTGGRWSDTGGRRSSGLQAEEWTSQMMRAGVSLAAVLIAAGFCRYLLQPAAPPPPVPAGGPAALLRGLTQFEGRAVINLGLLVLIATSVLRVAAAGVAFALAGERTLALTSGLVLLVLVLSFALGAVH